jgi:hypothetical protein
MADLLEIICMDGDRKLKVAVYTCITGGYDALSSPRIIDSRFEYFCFTDTPDSLVTPWRFKPIHLLHLNKKDQNRFIKMHPHEYFPDYDMTVYIDGSIQLIGDIYPLILNALNSPEDIFLYKHPFRNCVYAEAAACANYSHDWIWTIASQMRKYNMEEYPVDYGLYEAGVIIRKNTADVRSLMNMWWSEYCTGSKRDQLSLPVVAWRTGIPLGSLGESDPRFGHRYFRFINHPKRHSLKLSVRKHINRAIASLVSYAKLFGMSSLDKRK